MAVAPVGGQGRDSKTSRDGVLDWLLSPLTAASANDSVLRALPGALWCPNDASVDSLQRCRAVG